jgi:hypothetical protein
MSLKTRPSKANSRQAVFYSSMPVDNSPRPERLHLLARHWSTTRVYAPFNHFWGAVLVLWSTRLQPRGGASSRTQHRQDTTRSTLFLPFFFVFPRTNGHTRTLLVPSGAGRSFFYDSDAVGAHNRWCHARASSSLRRCLRHERHPVTSHVTHTHTCTHTHTRTHAHTHMYTCTRTRTHMYTCTRTHTHTHTDNHASQSRAVFLGAQ